MDFQKILDAQMELINEYSFNNKSIRSILNQLQKASEDTKTKIENLDIKIIKEICERQKTRVGFKTAKAIISGFYSYLKCSEIVEQISCFEYVNRLRYFASLRHLKEVFDNNITRLLDDEDILDKNRLGNLRMCVYLIALGLSAEEIAALKKSDYNFSDLTLSVKDKVYHLPDFISNDIHCFIDVNGYFSPRGDNEVFYNFIDSNGLIKQTRMNAPINKDSIYQILHRDMPLMDFDMTDVNKSKEIWQLLKDNGIDLDNPDVIKFYDLDKIAKVVHNANIGKKEMSVFIDALKDYYNW